MRITTRLAFSITLEEKVQLDNHEQSIDGRMVAIPTVCAKRMDGITIHQDELQLHLLNLN